MDVTDQATTERYAATSSSQPLRGAGARRALRLLAIPLVLLAHWALIQPFLSWALARYGPATRVGVYLLTHPVLFTRLGLVWYAATLLAGWFVLSRYVIKGPRIPLGLPFGKSYRGLRELGIDLAYGIGGAVVVFFGSIFAIRWAYIVFPQIGNDVLPGWLSGYRVSTTSTGHAAIDAIFLAVVGLAITVPAEELMYRGLILPTFAEIIGKWGGILAAAVAFIAIQIYPPIHAGGNGIKTGVLALILAVVHGWIAWRRGRLFPSIVAHVLAFVPAAIMYY